jgi:hypothetical protein
MYILRLLIAAVAISFVIATKETKRPSHTPLASFAAQGPCPAKPVSTTAATLCTLRSFQRLRKS